MPVNQASPLAAIRWLGGLVETSGELPHRIQRSFLPSSTELSSAMLLRTVERKCPVLVRQAYVVRSMT